MIRTLGLRRALCLLGRGSRGGEDDGQDGPQRRRPTASARRERAATVEFEEPQQDVVHGEDEEEVHGCIRFAGGPYDTSVLTSYADHIVIKVWEGKDRDELKLASHGRKVVSLGCPPAEIEGVVAAIWLNSLITYCIDTGDRGLLSAFAERWHKETSNFHLPIGEVTITLDDVSSLLHLPCLGAFHSFDPIDTLKAAHLLVDLLGVSGQEAMGEIHQCHDPYVRLSWLREVYHNRCLRMEWIEAARAYLLHLVGCTIFADKSAGRISVVYLEPFRDLSHSSGYAWGAAALVHMYENLNEASHQKTKHLAEFITLLQRIARILEDLIDQRLVAPDTQVHSALQQCITLASGVTERDNVYVRSRSRKACAERRGRAMCV